ncbi:hypothetical protein ACUY24_11240 [Corynebacterium simulans]
MKKRALVAALCCLSTASTTAVAAPIATAQTATANKTMANQYQPTFTEPSTPFGTIGDNTSEKVSVLGIPSGTKLTALEPNSSDGGSENQKLYAKEHFGQVWLQIFPSSYSYGKTVSKTVDFAVEYPDGSTEIVTHTFTVHPAEKHQHNPTLDEDIIEVGKTTTVKVLDIPSSSSVTPLKVPQDWNVKQEGNTFTVTPPVKGNGEFVYKVAFSDGTSKIVTNSVQANKVEVVPEPTTPKETEKTEPTTPKETETTEPTTPKETEKTEPTTPKETEKPQLPGENTETEPADDKQSSSTISGGSSTAGIIAGVIGAVLAIALSIGGAAFAGLIPGLKLPF